MRPCGLDFGQERFRVGVGSFMCGGQLIVEGSGALIGVGACNFDFGDELFRVPFTARLCRLDLGGELLFARVGIGELCGQRCCALVAVRPRRLDLGQELFRVCTGGLLRGGQLFIKCNGTLVGVGACVLDFR